MQTSGPSRTGKISAIIIAVLIGVAFFAYYEGTQQPAANASDLSSLQSKLASLEQVNQALQSQLASTSNHTQPSLGAQSLYSTVSPSVVTVQGYELTTQASFFGPVSSLSEVQGSGFAVSYQGSYYIVTNNHVVSGVSNITVTFSDGNAYPASVKGTDPYRDLAVLSVQAPASEFHPLTVVGSPQAVQVGETVYAIGSPFGLSGSLTVGVVSQVGRTITESNTQFAIPDIIQFSAAINPGNSGGPLLDSGGEVIGITTAAVSNSQGLGFAIPASTLSKELGPLITTGNYTLHPYLGITSVDMTYQLAQAAGTNVTYGIMVQTVVSGGPASTAGIRGGTRSVTVEGQSYQIGGDIIVSINGAKVVNSDALVSYLEEHAIAGQTVQLGIIRSGTPMTINVTLGSLP
ncbi:MAG: trypsin-like peptidase domain-containing protein [Nitrososphaerota archaeon]|nr:trypsin-like peptidase domain-containing protein [Nitrososphaerota archaeon]MDG7023142.1 trypsin-like peptidase domain-containing protein [Nitrososphaerota archaeon]